jgi:hypothetical protein
MARNLIASDRVEGTAVCRPGGKKIGVIRRLMIDKVTGNVAYAILTFGGFLHFGERHFPVPWAALSYNAVLQAYEVDIADEQLHDAPFYVGDWNSIGAIGPGKFPSTRSTARPITGSDDLRTGQCRRCRGCLSQ